ncbi:hypothetical protein H8E77_16805 [bacterium]|nr:hypothetical protein [bacterium]
MKYGQTSVILGSDAERESWERILNDSIRISEGVSIAADLVKISHHGSKRGIADSLWEKLTFDDEGKRECYAVLTPFFAQRLPDKQAIEHIRRHTEKIFSTSLSALPFRYRQPQEFLSEYQLKRQLKRAKVDAQLLAEPPETISRCSFSFGADGDYLGSEFEGRGGQFLPA